MAKVGHRIGVCASTLMPEFHPQIPKGCPPDEALPVDATIYRGIKKPPMGEKDFVPQAESARSNCDKSYCAHWGLSVWIDMADVRHAQSLFHYMKKWAIAKGSVVSTDGKLQKTPGHQQPNHHTFWKYKNISLVRKFAIVQQPKYTKNA